MAMIDAGSGGGFNEEEARRRALLARMGRTSEDGPQISEGDPGDFGSMVDRAAPATFSPSGQSTVRDASDRSQTTLSGQPTSPFSGNERENRGRFAISAEDRAMMDRIIADSQRQNAPQPQTSQFATRVGREAFGPITSEQQAAGVSILPVGAVAGLIGRAAAPVVRAVGSSPLGQAIAGRLGIGAQAAKPAAQVVGPQTAAQAGRGFQLVGGAADDAIEAGWMQAQRARSAAAGAREAAGITDDAAAAAARASQQTPLAQAIAGRLRSTPIIRAATPGAIGAGAALGAGALAGSGVLGNAGQEDGTENPPDGGQTNVGGGQTPSLVPPRRQGAQITPEQQAAIQAEIDRVARENAARNAPQGGQAPYVPPGSERIITGPYIPPQTGGGTALGPTPVHTPTQTQRALGPAGGQVLPPTGRIPRGTIEAPPVIGQPGTGTPPIGAAPGRGRAGGPPMGVTPGQTPAGPTTGPVPGGPLNSEAMRTQVIADLNGIAQQINAGPQTPDVMALFLSQGSKLLDLIAEQEKALRAQAAQDGSSIDPATQNTLDTLREQLNLQLKSTKERLNARGLLDSGILVEAEQMLVKGNLSDQAKILAERLSRIQNNLNSGLASFRSQRVDTASRFGMAGAQAQSQAEEAERRRMDDLKRVLVQGRLGVADQYGREEEAFRQREFTASENDLDRQAAVAKYQADLAARAGDREAEQRFRAQEAELNRENARLIAEMNAQAAAGRQQPQQPTSTSVDLATNNVIAQIRNAGSRDAAIASVQAAQGQPGFETVNWNAVLDAINTAYPESGGFKWPWEP